MMGVLWSSLILRTRSRVSTHFAMGEEKAKLPGVGAHFLRITDMLRKF